MDTNLKSGDNPTARAKHMKWCKERALDYLGKGKRTDAVASMLSDLGKHPETASSAKLGFMLSMAISSDNDAREFIEGFN